MYRRFLDIYRQFEKSGVERPLEETVRLIDLLTAGAVRKADLSILEREGIDLADIAKQRKAGKPMEYILGMAPFMGEMLLSVPGALIPREETELLTTKCLDLLDELRNGNDGLTIVEIGTGCGNIAVSLALKTEDTKIFASDISEEAVEVARRNVERFSLEERITLLCGDLFEPLEPFGLEGSVDLVVCNPPYIPTGSLGNLASEIIDHEPSVALDAGAYGIDIFRRLIKESQPYLRGGGMLAFEIGRGQDRLATRLLGKNGCFGDIRQYDDGADVRAISASKIC